mgnify:CR=1 FL=1
MFKPLCWSKYVQISKQFLIFVNTFTSVISEKYSKIKYAILDLKKNGALYTDMSGSGSTVFGVFLSDCDLKNARNALSSSWNVCTCS